MPLPTVLVTRKLSDRTEARVSADYDARLNPADEVWNGDALIERCQGVDAVIACHSELFSADVVARRARGFDMQVHYHNRHRLPPELEHGAIYHETLDSLLPVADFLSLHCPATPETTGLLDRERLARLPDGAVVVNTARGALVGEPALADALRSGKLAAAGLDVFATEPRGNPAFAALDNLLMLPHIGSATVETRDAIGLRALDHLDAFFGGRECGDRVACPG